MSEEVNSSPVVDPVAADPAVEQAAIDPAAPADQSATDPAAEPQGAPEAYAEYTMPEGMTLDAEAATAWNDIAKELNLPQEKSQQVADIAAQMIQRQAERFMAEHTERVAAWGEQTRTDKEIGGEKLPAVLGGAREAVELFGGEDVMALLEETGLGNHPAMIKMFHRVRQAVSDDSFVSGQRAAPSAGMYDYMNNQ